MFFPVQGCHPFQIGWDSPDISSLDPIFLYDFSTKKILFPQFSSCQSVQGTYNIFMLQQFVLLLFIEWLHCMLWYNAFPIIITTFQKHIKRTYMKLTNQRTDYLELFFYYYPTNLGQTEADLWCGSILLCWKVDDCSCLKKNWALAMSILDILT